MNSDKLKINFGENKNKNNWRVVNDGVMGGLSKGSLSFTENSAFFSGTVSLENNGGFSSFRSDFSDKDLSEYSRVSLKYKSSGISMAMTIQVSEVWYVPNFKKELPSTKGNWKVLTINLDEFQKHYIGKPMEDMMKKNDIKEIVRIGFITNEKKAGEFSFEIDYLEFS